MTLQGARMPIRAWIATILAAFTIASPAAAVQRSDTLAIGPSPQMAHADATSGKVFVVNAGVSRGGPGSIAVLERSGRITTIGLEIAPVATAASTALRKVLVAGGTNQLAMLDMDS